MNAMGNKSECELQCITTWGYWSAPKKFFEYGEVDARRARIRGKLRDLAGLSVVYFTVSRDAVHMILGNVQGNNFLTRQWVFRPQTSWATVSRILEQSWSDSSRRYVIFSNRARECVFCEGHFGAQLTRDCILLHLPGVHCVQVECFSRLTWLLEPYDFGSKTYEYLRELGSIETRHYEEGSKLCALVRQSASADIATIFRLLVRGLIFGSKAFKRTPRCRCDLEVKAC